MRTSEEAHAYMDQHPCACGDIEFARESAVVTEGDVLCSRYSGKCRSCGAMRELVFELPLVQRPLGPRLEFGGADPSRLLDPGEWMAMADYYAKLEPGTPDDVDIARAAIEEVLKFVPPGAERVPDDAFWSERGRAVRDREPGRFRRARLEAVRDAYVAAYLEHDLTLTHVEWKHTGDGALPYTADVDGRRLTIRVNDFPAEPLYTLIVDGVEQRDLDDWPSAWVKPGAPQHLLDLVRPKR